MNNLFDRFVSEIRGTWKSLFESRKQSMSKRDLENALEEYKRIEHVTDADIFPPSNNRFHKDRWLHKDKWLNNDKKF